MVEEVDRTRALGEKEEKSEEDEGKRRRLNEMSQEYNLDDLINEALDSMRPYSAAEVYSPPRIVEEAMKRGLKGLWSLDLTTVDPDDGKSWDFNDEEKRRKAKALVTRDRQWLLIGSPMCTAFSILQNISKHLNVERKKIEFKRATTHIKFTCELYKLQIDRGRYFLHEHPRGATSSKLA